MFSTHALLFAAGISVGLVLQAKSVPTTLSCDGRSVDESGVITCTNVDITPAAMHGAGLRPTPKMLRVRMADIELPLDRRYRKAALGLVRQECVGQRVNVWVWHADWRAGTVKGCVLVQPSQTDPQQLLRYLDYLLVRRGLAKVDRSAVAGRRGEGAIVELLKGEHLAGKDGIGIWSRRTLRSR